MIVVYAFLAVATTLSIASWDAPTAIAVSELRRLFNVLVTDSVRSFADVIAWPIDRQRHQDQARAGRYARQTLTETLRSPARHMVTT